MDADEKRVKSEARDELDRISALPLHLKESILERLPIKDAMRTSIWSSSWRYCWIGMQSFDLEAMGDTDVEVFHKTIDRILLLHPGRIQCFTFLIPDTGNYLDVNLSDWFLVLSKKGIWCIKAMAYYTPNKILMPKSLFQCGDLRRLDLLSFQIVPPPNFAGFNNLVSLLIDNCKIPSDKLGSLISHCPLLENLWLVYTCRKYRNQQPLIINALNLKGLFFIDDSLGTIIFQNVPKLIYAFFEFLYLTDKKHKRPCISWDFICSFSGIRELHFQILLLGPVIGKWPRFLPTRLENLRDLTLSCVSACAEDNLRVVFCFLRSSPCLQFLYIKFEKRKTSERSIEDAVKLLETELLENNKLSNLSNIEFMRMNWLRPEIMLMKVMLSRCSNLKSFRIVADGRKLTDDFIKQVSKEFEEIPNKDKLSYY